MNPTVEIRSLGTSKRLKANSQWSINAAAVSCETLIADGVTECFSRSLRKDDGAGEEICVAEVIGIVRRGNERGRANIQLRGWYTRFEALLICRRKRDCFDNSSGREGAGPCGTFFQWYPGVGA